MSDFDVRFGPCGGCAFVFRRELTAKEARAFHEDTGVWPIHTVDGKLRATNPAKQHKAAKST